MVSEMIFKRFLVLTGSKARVIPLLLFYWFHSVSFGCYHVSHAKLLLCCASSETMLMLMVIAMIWGGKIYSGLGFFDFSIGVIRPIFHRLGMLSVDRFTSLVTYAILIAPK